jgi:hypothetical protein
MILTGMIHSIRAITMADMADGVTITGIQLMLFRSPTLFMLAPVAAAAVSQKRDDPSGDAQLCKIVRTRRDA